MLRRINSVIYAIGRATTYVLGLLVLAGLLLGPVSIGLAAVGDPLLAGRANDAGAKVTSLVANLSGAVLRLTNQGTGPALDLRVQAGTPPLSVNSTARVAKLNADTVDGKHASELGPRGYAAVKNDGTFDRAKGVTDIAKSENLYCFDLDFAANVAVGSPYINNSGVVATWTPGEATVGFTCPEGYRDAAVKTYASDTGTANGEINFKIIFE